LSEHSGSLAAWLERIAADIARAEGKHRREVARLVERVGLIGEQVERLAGMIELLDEQINRAYEQGRRDAEDQWRMREQHLRDQLRADLERAVEETHQAALQRGIEIGRAQRMQEEEAERRERSGLDPDVMKVIDRIQRRLTDGA